MYNCTFVLLLKRHAGIHCARTYTGRMEHDNRTSRVLHGIRVRLHYVLIIVEKNLTRRVELEPLLEMEIYV